jgi:opacity protein-like surface antigen
MERIQLAMLALVMALPPAVALAQTSPRGSVSASIGADRVFRAEDRSFGTVASPGVGVAVRVRPQLGVGLDVHRATGLDVTLLPCTPPAGVPCIGSGREGVMAATTTSATVAWYASDNPRLQPYVLGGVSAVRSRSVTTRTDAGPDGWRITETEDVDTGVGVTAGVGVAFLVADHIVIKPEWRLSSGSMLGRANLGVMRTSLAVGYGW